LLLQAAAARQTLSRVPRGRQTCCGGRGQRRQRRAQARQG
jgi:hypothetical protein